MVGFAPTRDNASNSAPVLSPVMLMALLLDIARFISAAIPVKSLNVNAGEVALPER